jgi:hypothetical protein
MFERGNPVRLFASSADASTAVTVSLYDPDGNAVTIDSTMRLVISTLHLFLKSGGAGTYVQAFTDKNADGNVDAGEVIARAEVGVPCDITGTVLYTVKGKNFRVKADGAGQVDVAGCGWILNT